MTTSQESAQILGLLKDAFVYVKGFPLFVFALAYSLVILLAMSLVDSNSANVFAYLICLMPIWVIIVYVMETRIYNAKTLSERAALRLFLRTENITILERKALTYGWTAEQLAQSVLLDFIKENSKLTDL